VLGAPDAEALVAWDGSGALELHPAGSASVVARKLVDLTRSVGDVELARDAERRFACPPGAFEHLAARGAVLVAADALGAAQRMLELTVEYVQQRVQFGVPVGSFQAVKHAAAEMLVALEGTRAAVYYAAWAVGANEPKATTDAWVAKAQAGHAASDVADKALFLHGAVGYTWEHDLQLLFKRAKSDAQLFGGSEVYEDLIADALKLVSADADTPSDAGETLERAAVQQGHPA
jgi:alkylation response protein AidB-like acyl-CoA dehydrogenase